MIEKRSMLDGVGNISLPDLDNLALKNVIAFHKGQFNYNRISYEDFFFPAEFEKLIPKLACYEGLAVSDKKIILPKHQELDISLGSAYKMRRSVRESVGKEVCLEKLSTLLKWSVGSIEKSSRFRTYPSAGALYPVEVFCLCKKVGGIPKNELVKYHVGSHTLERMGGGKSLDIILHDIKGRGWLSEHVVKSSIVFFLISFLQRSAIKYGSKAYAFSLLEAGHMAQNIHLTATGLDLDVCCIGGFDEEMIHPVFSDFCEDIICTYVISLS